MGAPNPKISRRRTPPIIDIYTFCTPTIDSFHKIYTRPSNVCGLGTMRGAQGWRPIRGSPVEGLEQRRENFYADFKRGG